MSPLLSQTSLIPSSLLSAITWQKCFGETRLIKWKIENYFPFSRIRFLSKKAKVGGTEVSRLTSLSSGRGRVTTWLVHSSVAVRCWRSDLVELTELHLSSAPPLGCGSSTPLLRLVSLPPCLPPPLHTTQILIIAHTSKSRPNRQIEENTHTQIFLI